MLKINPDPKFTADVSVTVPGQVEPATLPLTFKYRGRKEFGEFIEWTKGKNDDNGKVIEAEKTLTEAFPEFVVGWGLQETFNSANIETFLNNYPAAYFEIFTEYTKLLVSSRIKN